jgi:ureidoglycolate dehydrogenase (NAD+)
MRAQASGKHIPVAELRAFAAQILAAGGFAPSGAQQTADLLVWADARGVESHGVLRIPRYLEMVRQGLIDGRAEPRRASEFGAISVLEGHNGPGALGMNMAMARAVELAGSFGIGCCSARNVSHAGAVGYFAEAAARAGRVGIVMTASKPLMSYFGAKAEGVSTNPIAIAAPNGEGRPPLLLDMSTSAAALGKIMAARNAGVPIPAGWGADASGADTTDPKAVQFLLPMAGAKGSGLSLMIEVLTSVLAGNPLVARALAGNPKGAFNGIAIALNVEAFGDPAAFRDGIAELGAAIKALPRADGVEEILLPGERGYARAAQAAAEGIALEPATARSLVALAQGYNLLVPEALR